jgi:hypothetical protein
MPFLIVKAIFDSTVSQEMFLDHLFTGSLRCNTNWCTIARGTGIHCFLIS